MRNFLFEECSHEERMEKLNSIAAGKERITYLRNLTEAEIDAESKELASLCRRRNELEEEKKNVAKDYQTQIDSVKQNIDRSATLLEDGRKECVEDCFKVLDIDAREVGFYNNRGELVRMRKALDSDLQLDMFYQQRNEETRKALESANRLGAGVHHDDYEEAQIVTDQDSYQEIGQESGQGLAELLDLALLQLTNRPEHPVGEAMRASIEITRSDQRDESSLHLLVGEIQ